ncbi:M56 family metallopeptidase [Marinicella rhabdoformis]|uniref:M56 family metallopeptidase n=1 Tax=Marinicella rhabdoformis TaxID=2580566 RepID=UPI0012AEB850|nr:M56 family metallopeptidase [Marinicella rhabdoformis]
MSDWLLQNTLTLSVTLMLILFLRLPLRKYLGAHISYALWLLPLMVLALPSLLKYTLAEEQWLSVTTSFQPQLIQGLPQATLNPQYDWLLAVWLIGFLITAVLKIVRMIRFNHHALLNAQYLNPEIWQLETGRVNITQSKHIKTPCISGLLFPTIYLPTGFDSDYSHAQQRLIIQHELQHHKNGDLWFLMLAEIYCSVFWFNPLTHIVKPYFIVDQELACDRQVLKEACQQTRLDYAQALHQGLVTQLSPMSLSFFTVKHVRFIMLNKHQNNTTKTVIGFTLMVLLTFTASVFSQRAIVNEDSGQKVSFNFNESALPMVIRLIADATEVEETFVNEDLLAGKYVTKEVRNTNVFKALDDILADQDLQVSRTDKVWTFSSL